MSPSTARCGVHRWLISDDSAGLNPVRVGIAKTCGEAWFAALRTGHTVLLDGTIIDLAISVDDELPTLLYSPGRDLSGRLDPAVVGHDLAELARATTTAPPMS